ncbi:hypothetical protein Y886_43660, partial [Xanthomonas hyacinthi DSM 19077]
REAAAASDVDKSQANETARGVHDGRRNETGEISEGANVHTLLKSETGWFLPIRFSVRLDTKEE